MNQRNRYGDAVAAFSELRELLPEATAARMEQESVAALAAMAQRVTGPDEAGRIAIQFWGFALVLLADGTYFITDTSGG